MHATASIPENTCPVTPDGFKKDYDPETLRLFGHKEWEGPKAYAANEQLGAWATWTPELGIVVTIDTAGAEILHTVDELQAFHTAIGGLLAQIGGTK